MPLNEESASWPPADGSHGINASTRSLGDVAVVIPTYRRPDVLPMALESVLHQSLKVEEVVVVDDGSGDHTPDVVRRYPQVKLLQQANAGPAAARNLGLRATTARYVSSLDHDDEWDAPFLKTAVDALEESGADVAWVNFRQTGDYAFSNYLESDAKAQCLLQGGDGKIVELDHDGALEFFLFSGGAASNSALVFRRESLGEGWDASAQVADDLLVMTRLLFEKKPLRCLFVTHPLWTKHEDAGSYSRNSEITVRRCLHDFQVVAQRGEAHFPPHDRRRWQKKMGDLRYKLAYHCLWNTGLASAIHEARLAFNQAGLTWTAIRLCVTAILRKCARLAGIPPLSELRQKDDAPHPGPK